MATSPFPPPSSSSEDDREVLDSDSDLAKESKKGALILDSFY